jgi:uncharacterized protein
MSWSIRKESAKPITLKRPILVEGLPGIGNVGKIALDYIAEEMKAKKLLEFSSHKMPHSVFVNEKNIVELPKIELYHAKGKKNDLLFIVGDVQPVDEVSCYEFCEKVLDVFKEFDGSEIVTIAGIGLATVPQIPKVYCTGNSKDAIKKFTARTSLKTDLYGVVGPIIGVSGLLLGLAKKRNIPAVCILAETIGHPMYIGVRGAREVIQILSTKLDLGVKVEKMDKDIKEIESELANDGAPTTGKDPKLKKFKSRMQSEVSYIG